MISNILLAYDRNHLQRWYFTYNNVDYEYYTINRSPMTQILSLDKYIKILIEIDEFRPLQKETAQEEITKLIKLAIIQ